MTDPYTRLSVEEAVKLVLDNVDTLESEGVPLIEAVGRVASQNLTSDIDIPPFDNVAMDGFALRAHEIEHASSQSPVTLKVIAEAPAGTLYDGPIGAGECVRIMTGAPLPPEADCMVKYELVDYLEGDGRIGSTVAFTEPTKVGSNIRRKGEEIKNGSTAIAKGEIVSAAGIGFLASCGVTTVPVYRRPKVGVISIGSELVDPTETPYEGKIRNSNGFALASLVIQAGGIPIQYDIVPDDPSVLTQQVIDATKECDFIVTSGGASNGDFDFIRPVIENEGTLLMTLVNMRPGKCQTFGLVNDVPVFGLPGNPAAAWCGFEMIVRQALRKMQGYTSFARPIVEAHLSQPLRKKNQRRMYLRATLSRENGKLVVTPAKNQSSSLFSTIQRGNCLIVKPDDGHEYEADETIEVILMDAVEGTVV